MKQLHRFIPSPRAGKRFINIYRLLRASVKEKERDAFVGSKEGGSYQTAMLLLAILTAYPDQATEIFRELIEEEPTGEWSEFCAAYEARMLAEGSEASDSRPGTSQKIGKTRNPEQKAAVGKDGSLEAGGENDKTEWTELFARLEDIEESVGGRPMGEFLEWAPRVARYSFQSGRVLYYQHE